MTRSLIVAMSENRVIGREGRLPWHLPADLKRFKQLTTGHPIIMGRKTFESIGRALPNRRNIVITRQRNWRAAGAETVHSLTYAIRLASEYVDDEVFIIGGADVFRDALPQADTLYLTLVHETIEGDVHFPEVDWSEWTCVEDHRYEPDSANPLPYSFRKYVRRREGG
jgi:dihydrofolate reductase